MRAPACSGEYPHDFHAPTGEKLLSEQKPQLEGIGSKPG